MLLLTDDDALLDAVEARARSAAGGAAARATSRAQALASSRADPGRHRSTRRSTISNAYAPEHLILALRDAARLAAAGEAAGSVFLGDWTPEALGDYCSGTNHVLPTGGAARASAA